MRGEITVLQPGLFSTIQDMGRFGFLKFGVPHSGAMDNYAAVIGNLLLQNSRNAAVLEMTQQGPKLQFSSQVEIVITGARLSPKINQLQVQNNIVYKISPGDVLSFGKREAGCRAYLSVKGGFRTEKILESRSWYEGVTTFNQLKKGMLLEYESPALCYGSTHSTIKAATDYLKYEKIETLPGPEYHLLTTEEKAGLFKQTFTIDKNNNRMAIQLIENLNNTLEAIITGPVVPGSVQLTPSGKLIILMRDCQTTGGYPRVLQITEQHLNVLAQKVLGDKIQFVDRKLKIEEASAFISK